MADEMDWYKRQRRDPVGRKLRALPRNSWHRVKLEGKTDYTAFGATTANGHKVVVSHEKTGERSSGGYSVSGRLYETETSYESVYDWFVYIDGVRELGFSASDLYEHVERNYEKGPLGRAEAKRRAERDREWMRQRKRDEQERKRALAVAKRQEADDKRHRARNL